MRTRWVIAALIAAACSGGGTPDDTARAEIREQGERWIEAARAEDAEGLAALYAEDALFLPPGAAPMSGRDTIRSLFEAQFAAMDAEYDFEIDAIVVADGWAWRRGSYRATARTGDGSTTRVDDKFVDIWRRDSDGRWRIAVDIWNANPAPDGGG